MKHEQTDEGLSGGYARIWRDYLRPRWRLLGVTLILMAIVAAGSSAYAKFVQYLFEGFATEDLSVLKWAPWVILGLTVAKSIALYYQLVLTNKVLADVDMEMQGDMYRKLVFADLSNLQSEAPAATASRFSADVTVINQAIKSILLGVSQGLIIIATFALMLTIDWVMTLAILIVFAISMGPIGRIGAAVNRNSRDVQEQIGDMTGEVNEGLSGIRLVRTYRLEDWLLGQANAVFDRLRASKVLVLNWQARIEPIVEVMGGVSLALLLFILIYQVANGGGSLANFMALLTGFGVASASARRLSGTYAEAQRGLASITRVFDMLDRKDAIVERDDATVLERSDGRVAFEGVGFTYSDGTQALADINLEIEPGQKVAFVGRSGAGKSSLFNLLPRLFDPNSGAVRIDSHDLRDLSLSSLRAQIAVVSQDAFLLTGTVADNIRFGAPDATQAEVEDAARMAEAHDFIAALPRGYDTEVMSSNVAFSGGEKQRISIARAIVRDAPVLLLDEPTSALDAKSEASIRAALDRLSEGRTTLIIAHRLSTILDADKIVVMEGGRIIDAAPHAELLARGGVYAELYKLQFDH